MGYFCFQCELQLMLLMFFFLASDFNLPKLHNIEHYAYFIRQFGTTDGYNTEYTERLHIEFVKDAWRASNHKEALLQMMQWLSRREKVFSFESRFLWLQGSYLVSSARRPFTLAHFPRIIRPRSMP